MSRILVVGPSWVGDMVMAQSLFSVIKQSRRDCEISVLSPPWCLPILQRMPEVHQSILMPVGHGSLQLATRWRLGRELKRQNFDRAIILPGSLKSALVPCFAGITRRSGYVGEQRWGLINDIRKLDKDRMPKNVQRYVYLGLNRDETIPEVLPEPRLKIDKPTQNQALSKFNLTVDKPVVAFCPGAEYGPAKRWPAQKFAELAKSLVESGWQVWLFGSDNDRAIADEINQITENLCINLAGETALGEAVDLMALARYAVSNDSGLMHVAAAVGCHVVAIYGSSSPIYTPPLTSNCDILSLGLDCSPCFKRDCPLGHMNCLNMLNPDLVRARIADS